MSNQSMAIIDPMWYSNTLNINNCQYNNLYFGAHGSIVNDINGRVWLGFGDILSLEEVQILVKFGRDSVSEEIIREQNPSLQILWEEYQTMLVLVRDDNEQASE